MHRTADPDPVCVEPGTRAQRLPVTDPTHLPASPPSRGRGRTPGACAARSARQTHPRRRPEPGVRGRCHPRARSSACPEGERREAHDKRNKCEHNDQLTHAEPPCRRRGATRATATHLVLHANVGFIRWVGTTDDRKLRHPQRFGKVEPHVEHLQKRTRYALFVPAMGRTLISPTARAGGRWL